MTFPRQFKKPVAVFLHWISHL